MRRRNCAAPLTWPALRRWNLCTSRLLPQPSRQSHPHEQTLLVFDFGGGTLDLTVLKVGAAGASRCLLRWASWWAAMIWIAPSCAKVAPYLGTQSAIDINYDGRLIPFPRHLAGLLDQWQTIPTLTPG
ncbi:MAG: hypothetical protein IPK16_29265 [Anaerolineales bacterium]|nr:hypothetical protein [Anaerolineales bacterium]